MLTKEMEPNEIDPVPQSLMNRVPQEGGAEPLEPEGTAAAAVLAETKEEDGNESLSSSLKLTVQSEFDCYERGRQQTMFVNCHVTAPVCPDNDTARKPIDVVIVLDRSGSMRAEGKLNLCLQTIEFLVKELSVQDRLSLVTYDTYVQTNLKLTTMDRDGRSQVQQLLKGIREGSATNLSGGLLAGLKEVQEPERTDGKPPNPVKSVLLLTDGMANCGVTDIDKLVAMVQSCLHKDVSLFTFGYGTNHNEDMLCRLSDAGRGVYYFVKDVDTVSMAFADCLGGLLSVVAQNIRLTCTTADGCQINLVHTNREVTTSKPNQEFIIEMGDLYGEEERDVLLQIEIPSCTSTTDTTRVVHCTLEYANLLTASSASSDVFETLQRTLTVRRPETLPTDLVAHGPVIRQKIRVLTADTLRDASHDANAGNLVGGRDKIQATLQSIESTLQAYDPNDAETRTESEAFVADLNDCLADMANQDSYKSGGGKFRVKSKMQKTYAQRSNCVEMEMLSCAMDEGVGLSMLSAPPSKLRNKKKQAMMFKAASIVRKSRG